MEPADTILTIGADGHDGARLEADLRDRIARKARDGAYAGAAVPASGRIELPFRRRTQTSNAFFLRCLREAARVDICDFEIRERRARLAPLLVRLKRAVWSLLRFYTYRLWSQQNEVNSLLVTGIESVREECTARTESLEARIAAIEQNAAAPPAPRAPGDSGPGESA